MDKNNLCLSLSDIESGLCFPSVRKLGILGGSFNPIHYGHLILGRTALKTLEEKENEDNRNKRNSIEAFDSENRSDSFLSRECIVFLPTGVPYHKKNSDLLPFSERSTMLFLALKEENERYRNDSKKNHIGTNRCSIENKETLPFFYSTIEGERSGNSYSYDSALILKKTFPNAEIFLIIGTDEFFTLENWYKIEELGKMLHFLVANRNGVSKERELTERKKFLNNEFGLSCSFLNMKKINYSSSLIREKLENGDSISGILPVSVEKYIMDKNLYH